MTRCTSVVICMATLFLAGCEQVHHLEARTSGFTETRVKRISHIPGTFIRIEIENGSIAVEATDRSDLQIKALIRARSKERLGSTSIVTRRQKGESLRIEVKWPEGGRKNTEYANLEIYVPDVNGIFASTSNAPILVTGSSGPAHLKTSNDRIEATNHRGSLRATTSNDHILIVRNKGSIMARSSNGDIRIRGVTGPVDARTSNGAIAINSADSSVVARTSDGEISIELTDISIGPVAAKTSNDPVSLVIGKKFAGDVDLKTNERCIIDERLRKHVVVYGNKHVRLRIGNGAESKLATRNAPISVKVRDVAE